MNWQKELLQQRQYLLEQLTGLEWHEFIRQENIESQIKRIDELIKTINPQTNE